MDLGMLGIGLIIGGVIVFGVAWVLGHRVSARSGGVAVGRDVHGDINVTNTAASSPIGGEEPPKSRDAARWTEIVQLLAAIVALIGGILATVEKVLG